MAFVEFGNELSGNVCGEETEEVFVGEKVFGLVMVVTLVLDAFEFYVGLKSSFFEEFSACCLMRSFAFADFATDAAVISVVGMFEALLDEILDSPTLFTFTNDCDSEFALGFELVGLGVDVVDVVFAG